jgi:hypothetical protein
LCAPLGAIAVGGPRWIALTNRGGDKRGLEAADDTATCEAANGLVTGKCLGNGPDIAEAQIEQLLQGLHENLPSVVPSSAALS